MADPESEFKDAITKAIQNHNPTLGPLRVSILLQQASEGILTTLDRQVKESDKGG